MGCSACEERELLSWSYARFFHNAHAINAERGNAGTSRIMSYANLLPEWPVCEMRTFTDEPNIIRQTAHTRGMCHQDETTSMTISSRDHEQCFR